jgi:hypothetical protein
MIDFEPFGGQKMQLAALKTRKVLPSGSANFLLLLSI